MLVLCIVVVILLAALLLWYAVSRKHQKKSVPSKQAAMSFLKQYVSDMGIRTDLNALENVYIDGKGGRLHLAVVCDGFADMNGRENLVLANPSPPRALVPFFMAVTRPFQHFSIPIKLYLRLFLFVLFTFRSSLFFTRPQATFPLCISHALYYDF